MWRRRFRTEAAWQGGQWVTNSIVRYIFDGSTVVQERDANNIPIATYTRGSDASGTRQRAGGIGGLLARTDVTGSAYYHADGNGNITAMVNAQRALVAKYLYDPFGNILAQSGALAAVNFYRFSSKEAHPTSGTYYFGRRFYDPNLQRWANRDPLGYRAGPNLYS
jgi:RHS repeat-associated protein